MCFNVNTLIGNEDGSTLASTSSTNLSQFSGWTTHLMEQLGVPVEELFMLMNKTLTNKLVDCVKNAYLSTLLGCEGSHILMAHPVGGTAVTATYNFKTSVQARFECPVDPVCTELKFCNCKQGAMELFADYLTALHTLKCRAWAGCRAYRQSCNHCWWPQPSHATSYQLLQLAYAGKSAAQGRYLLDQLALNHAVGGDHLTFISHCQPSPRMCSCYA